MRTSPLPTRPLGRTGLQVSERGFGAWAIGGTSYGPVSRADALDALSCAEAHGCNVVDTAAVYGDSEARLGEFLAERRERWVVATKFSGQPEGLLAVLEAQLTRLRTDRIDLYQLHWAPRGADERLYDELERLRGAGKIRFIGVSLRSGGDLRHVLASPSVDVVQVPLSLMDPEPIASHQAALQQRQVGVIARSALRGGFLTGKYDAASRFDATGDQRGTWNAEEVRRLAAQAHAFAFVGTEVGSMTAGAIAYALSFATVSTVILGCKDRAQAAANFGSHTPALSPEVLSAITRTQRQLGLGAGSPTGTALRRLLGWLKRRG
jgi:aryl-alcohol dehydrogenase-like predicted oxidoreductase